MHEHDAGASQFRVQAVFTRRQNDNNVPVLFAFSLLVGRSRKGGRINLASADQLSPDARNEPKTRKRTEQTALIQHFPIPFSGSYEQYVAGHALLMREADCCGGPWQQSILHFGLERANRDFFGEDNEPKPYRCPVADQVKKWSGGM